MIICILAAKKIAGNYILVTPDVSDVQKHKLIEKSSLVITSLDSEISLGKHIVTDNSNNLLSWH